MLVAKKLPESDKKEWSKGSMAIAMGIQVKLNSAKNIVQVICSHISFLADQRY